MDVLGHVNTPNKECWKLEIAVDVFAEEMVKFYPDENQRTDVGLRALNKILALGHLKMVGALQLARIGTVITDGHYIGPHC